MRYLAILLVALCFSASAGQLIARQGDDWVLITDDACTNKAVQAHLPTPAEEWRAARGMFGGKLFEGCWLLVPRLGAAHVIYEDGDQGVIPAAEFRDPKGA